MSNHESRLMNIEMVLADCQKTIDELNEVVIKQSKLIDALVRQNRDILASLSQSGIKSATEEAPPPHY